MWKPITIPGKPSILLVDATRNLEGWEYAFTERLFASLQRSGLTLFGEKPERTQQPEQLSPCVTQNWNCLLLFVYPGAGMKAYWDWLQTHVVGGKVFAACMCQQFDEAASREVLQSEQTFAPIAVAPQSMATPRESGLFLLKFFVELNLHSAENITGKMAWFSFSKATALLKKRRYSAKFGLRC